jgi:hypothetical protein
MSEKKGKKKEENKKTKESKKKDFWGDLGKFVKEKVDCCLE